MLYTKKGDNGTTGTFGCDQKISKSSAIAEALGALDETNSYLGFCKAKSLEKDFSIDKRKFHEIIHDTQETLFIIQAEVAGAKMSVGKKNVSDLEEIINGIEKKLPPIKTFFIPGGSETGAMFDVARTIARRAERRVVRVSEEGKVKIGKHSLSYLNRLSSALYALSRLSAHLSGINEESPKYK
jgi:cob(I)alamin adenosyltransferase